MHLQNHDYDFAADALFLDFDNTLVDFAPLPESVVVPPDLITSLQYLQQAASGALAIVSGRPLTQIDHFLAPLRLPAAGVHGAERRSADGRMTQLPVPDIERLLMYLQPLAAQHAGLLLEVKRGALALHYRRAPHLEQICVQAMSEALAHEPGFALLRGSMVVEAKAADISKGDAIAAFMNEAPFAGRRPLFIGDDITDEAGFAWVQSPSAGGLGIKVGPGPSLARARIANPAAVRSMLAQVLEQQR
ncbi:trehalose-phosphatase [Collimonas sp.]|jgi:trehalose 6-phosphate phosphatase|uniref:trehalose-phosphatase n=1 Tax=Collimonas sp. TaxID=1963772 RepID=UPI002C5FA59B|nr:trehalose-phosphatase [Collimonas sp.]HWW07857.1 trehalose-phosphatase [Collimonas sp.]